MKKTIFSGVILFFVVVLAFSGARSEGLSNLVIESGGARTAIRFMERGTASIEIDAPGLETKMPTHMVEDGALAPAVFTPSQAEFKAVGPEISVTYSADPLTFTFTDKNGKVLLRLTKAEWSADGTYRLTFAKEKGDIYYGLGEMFAGSSFISSTVGPLYELILPKLRLNQDGKKLDVFGAHRPPSEMVLPFILNPRGYGLLIENPVRATIDLTGVESFTYSAMGGPLRFYVIAGASPAEIIDTYSRLTGRTPLPPRWVAGYMQSRYGYKSAEEFQGLMENFRLKNIPCDVLIYDLDWYSTGPDCVGMRMGDLSWATSRFPDPQGLMAEMDRRGFKAINIVDPAVRPSSYNFAEVRDKGLGVTDKDGNQLFFNHWGCPGALLLDYLNPATREWWGEKIKAIHKTGVDGWWTDKNEPEDDLDTMHYGGLPNYKGHNLQSVLQHKAMADMYAKDIPNERLFIMSRAGFVGDWRYGVSIWSGDIASAWGHLNRQIPVALSASLSGYGLWNSDVGGFHGTPNPELHVRWMEFGAFCPIFRAHGNHSIREPWAFGEKAEKILREVINLRYRLAPYHYTLFHELHETGKPPMRAMFLEFPEVKDAYGVDDQYMYGPWILVAPVTRKGAKSRTLWLPPGEWTDFWTGEVKKGPGRVRVDAPLERIPLFIRPGAIIPMDPLMQYLGEKPRNPVTFQIFPGATPSFYETYDDDGVSMGYKHGEFAKTRITVTPGDPLTVDAPPREGSFAGMVAAPAYELVIHNVNKPRAVTLGGVSIIDDHDRCGYDPTRKVLTVMVANGAAGFTLKVEK